jgi:tight adherence protein C
VVVSGVWINVAVFVGTTGILLAALFWRNRDRRQAVLRVRELGGGTRRSERAGFGEIMLSSLPAVGSQLLPTDEKSRTRLQQRLIEAGVYSRHAMAIFLAAKLLLVLCGMLAGVAIGVTGLLSPRLASLAGTFLGGLGLAGPGLWLDARKRKRHAALRRGLPDLLDMLVLCLEGGVSVTQGMQRVNTELHEAHPLLAAEMDIVQREMMLGLSVGEAMRKCADRVDLDDIRTLASVLLQNERYGASVAKALRIHAETLRNERQARAEEIAQRAAVKILFPTLLCIFPAIFIVILGPAALQIIHAFNK